MGDWINGKHIKKETTEFGAVIQESDLLIKSTEDKSKESNKENEVNKTGYFLELTELEMLSFGGKTEEEYFAELSSELKPLKPRKKERPANYEFMNSCSFEENVKRRKLFDKMKLRRF